MSEKEASNLTDSLVKFGFVEPIVINTYKDRENVIVGGHQRFYIVRELGHTEIPCVEVNLNLEQEQELNLRLNKNTGSWDYDILANFNEEVLLDVGFESEELDKFFGLDLEDKDPDEVPDLPKEPKAKLGDLYKLGNHRLLCGDATNEEDVARLMDGTKAHMVFTDPPYGVEYTGGSKKMGTIER